MDVTMIVDTLWGFLAAIGVFFMNHGFAVSSLGYMLLGWGLMFRGDNPFAGTEYLFILGNADRKSVLSLKPPRRCSAPDISAAERSSSMMWKTQ